MNVAQHRPSGPEAAFDGPPVQHAEVRRSHRAILDQAYLSRQEPPVQPKCLGRHFGLDLLPAGFGARK